METAPVVRYIPRDIPGRNCSLTHTISINKGGEIYELYKCPMYDVR